MLNDIVGEVLKNIVQTAIIKILVNRLLPYANFLFNYLSSSSYYLILIYLLSAVAILFVLYKFYNFMTYKKLNKTSSSKLTSITSKSDDFDLNPEKMERLRKKKYGSKLKSVSKKNLTTDLLSS